VTRLPESTSTIEHGLTKILVDQKPAQQVWSEVAQQLRTLVAKYRQG